MSYFDGYLYTKEDIPKLKTELKKWYLEYRDMMDDYESVSCGNNLLEYINPKLGILKEKINKRLELLSELDPTCPKTLL